MASWYNNLLTKTSSQISNLRSTYLAGDADGDTDDDTHVCRVLRGYYGEKGRPFPSWLPPDPKASAPTPQPVLVNNQVGARYGGLGQGQQQNQQQQPGGGLSSLWDSNASAAPPPQPQSLRAGRTPASLQPGGGDISRRPLPGQRAGSGQSNVSSYGGRSDAATAPPTATGGRGTSAQDLLRQRLWGGSRTTSPSQQGSSQGPFAPPAGSGGSGGGGGGNYEDRFAPTGAYDGASGGGNERPVMSANSPWSTGGDDFSGGGGGGGRAQRRHGLPSGPRGYR
ncbi:Sec1-binding region of Mso1-domain-containing protein [Dactylonectria estremocensis]|uniref:Sec1-binding region of Mso1-domain-containing protein n=1 Tax=Dactylonectria estremocensis TaxID=1079267 RepID=A0A9P9JA46_9HYPO|nr:Sec1-binding region of Mso1-domain-containing protein [Dactylonectria estremocensis]